MDDVFRRNSPARACFRIKRVRPAFPEFSERRWGALHGGGMEQLAVVKQQMRKLGRANTAGVNEDRIEYGIEGAGGARDDLQDFRRGGLLCQRLAQLVEQAGILDCNHRLAGEALDQLDLLLRERSNLLAIDANGAHQLVIL